MLFGDRNEKCGAVCFKKIGIILGYNWVLCCHRSLVLSCGLVLITEFCISDECYNDIYNIIISVLLGFSYFFYGENCSC